MRSKWRDVTDGERRREFGFMQDDSYRLLHSEKIVYCHCNLLSMTLALAAKGHEGFGPILFALIDA